MYQTRLEVVNACLGTLGEAPLNSLEDDHTFKESAIEMLKGSTFTLLKRALWFNTESIVLLPDANSKYIYIPTDALSIERIPDYTPVIAQRGRRIYDPVRNRYEWDAPVALRLVRKLDFDDLPFVAQDAAALSAVMRFQREFDGDQVRYNQINADRMRAESELGAMHIRELQPNLLDPIRKTMALYGMTRYRGPVQVPPRYVVRGA